MPYLNSDYCPLINNKVRIRQYDMLYDNNVSKILNPVVKETNNSTSDFKKIKTQNGCVYYESQDPRLLNSASYTRFLLDKPPYDSSIKLSEIYNENLRNYGKNYTSYEDINGGQNIYYINNKNDPNSNENDKRTFYVDPMGSGYNELCNVSKPKKNPLTATVNTDDGFCLTWMKDTTSNREDSMYYAQSAINRMSRNNGGGGGHVTR